jgi:hypothetical protein
MKKLVILALLAALVLTGCAGGKFLGFLATTDYVDAQTKAAVQQQAVEIEQLKAQLAEYQQVKEQAQAAAAQVGETQKAVQDLTAAAQAAEQKISTLPKEVIQQIIAALQTLVGQ